MLIECCPSGCTCTGAVCDTREGIIHRLDRDIHTLYCSNGESHEEEHGKENGVWENLVVYEG